MNEETGEPAPADEAFIKENIDVAYLKKAIDLDLVNSLLGQFAPAPAPAAQEPDEGPILEPRQEKSILSRIKDFWRGTDEKIAETESKIKDLLSFHEKAKEVSTLKREYEESISKKLEK
jgi:hypothetical protein